MVAVTFFAATAEAGWIDDFSTTTSPGLMLTAPGMVSHSDLGIAGVAGGDRHMTLWATQASSIVNGVGFEVLLDAGAYRSGPAAEGALELLYDGATLASDIGPWLDFLFVDFLMFDNAFGVDLDITATISDGVNTASLTIPVTAASIGPYTVAFDVDTFSGIGLLDLSNITSIGFFFDAGVAQDFELSAIRFQIPEPSAVVLASVACLAGAVLLVVRRRRRTA